MKNSLDAYQTFYQVARYRGFTQAAAATHTSQPNLTRTVKNLENELGCTLFVRSKKGVRLTPEGEKLYVHAAAAIEHLEAAEAEIEADRGLETGYVNIAVTEVALHCSLLPVMRRFRQRYPGAHVRVLNSNTPQALDNLRDGLADLAIVTTPLEETKSVICKELRKMQEVPVCSTAFSDRIGDKLSIEELAKFPLIGLGAHTGSFEFFANIFADHGIEFKPEIEASTADQILPMIKSDLGIGFIPMDFLDDEDDSSKLRVIELDTPIPERSVCVLKRRHDTLSLAAKTLEEMLVDTSANLRKVKE